eukprot:6876564-Prymnesium_polylepis.1
MPAWGADGNFSYPNGVVAKVYNRNVLALRPLGYKPSPSAGLATSPKVLGIPDAGEYAMFLCAGHRRESDVTELASQLDIKVPVIPFDLKIGGELHDVTSRKFITTLVGAINVSTGPKCVGAIISMRCKT